jgi:hypothetical protein
MSKTLSSTGVKRQRKSTDEQKKLLIFRQLVDCGNQKHDVAMKTLPWKKMAESPDAIERSVKI